MGTAQFFWFGGGATTPERGECRRQGLAPLGALGQRVPVGAGIVDGIVLSGVSIPISSGMT